MKKKEECRNVVLYLLKEMCGGLDKWSMVIIIILQNKSNKNLSIKNTFIPIKE